MVDRAADHARGGDARRRRVLGAAPWVLVLVAVGVVQAVREQWVDAAIFFVVTAGLVLDAAGAFDRIARAGPAASETVVSSRSTPERIGRASVWAGLAFAGVVLVVATRHGLITGIVALILGVLAVAIAWAPAPSRLPSPERRGARRRAAMLWAVVVVAAALWELATFTVGRIAPSVRPEFPSISEIVDPLLDEPVGRAVFIAVWFGLGAFLLTRARVRATRSTRRATAGRTPPAASDAPKDREP